MARVSVGRGLVLAVAVSIGVAACASSPVVPSVAPSPTPSEPTVAATPSALPVVGAGEPWIAFQQFTTKFEVALARPDGSGLYSPTGAVPGGHQTNPDWSPDGSQLVFAVVDGSRENLWVVNADGSDARPLADCEGDCMILDDPAWSPDGRAVLFSRMRNVDGNAVGTLEQVDIASGATSVIVQADPGHFYAGQRWSPDGTSVVLEVVELTSLSVDSDVKDVSMAIIEVAAPTPAGRELMGSGLRP